jgi:ATP-binding cassette subfamily B protein
MAARQQQTGKPKHGPGSRAAAMMPGEKAGDLRGTLRKLLSYLAPYKFRLFFVLLFAIASTIFAIVSPTILGTATDTIVQGLMSGQGVDYEALLKIIVFLIGLYAVSFGFSAAQGFIMAGMSQQITYEFRRLLSEKMDKLPVRYFDGMTHGEYQSRVINDIETVNQSLSQSLTQVITAAVTIIGTLIMMIRISLLMTVVALLVLPMSMVMIKLVVGKSQGHFKNQQKYLGEVNAHVEEMFTGHTVVKVFNKEEESQAEFDAMNDKLYESAWKSQFLSGIMMPATNLIGNLGYVLVCILGGYLAIAGRISIGNIQAFIQYVRSFNQPLQQVANAANLLQSTAAAAERIFEIIDEEEEEDAFEPQAGHTLGQGMAQESHEAAERTLRTAAADGGEAPAAKGRVEFEHINFGYKPDHTIIHDFSFVAEPGSRVAIVGPTGAGKTTIVKLLLRYYELNSGRILVDGTDITEYSRNDLREHFAMVLQDTWLFSGTMRENLKYGRPYATDEQMIEAAKAAHIHHFIKTLPDGYDTKINEDADNISQGQKQLLTIARAMLADNPILILDEATSSVDTRTERLIQQAMANLMEGRTSFIIAHRLSTIKDADTILVLDKGDIVEQGTHEELLEKGGAYAKLYNSQFEE